MMSFNRRILYFTFIYSLFLFSCSTSDIDEGKVNKLRPEVNNNANLNVDPNANVANDNETELNTLINLPFEAEENVFREDKVSGIANTNRPSPATDNKLTAVLKFSEENTARLIQQLQAKGTAFATKIDPEPWFPAELIAKSQTSGDESIKGIGYNADIFFKDPYNAGSIARVNDTDYFVLILQIK
jgi:hypothetical protein